MVSVTILADSEHRDFGGVCNHFVDVPFMTDSEHLDRWDYLDNDGGRNQLAQAAGIHNYDGGHNDNDSGRNQSAQAAGDPQAARPRRETHVHSSDRVEFLQHRARAQRAA